LGTSYAWDDAIKQGLWKWDGLTGIEIAQMKARMNFAEHL
jgi:hypothetical protein